MTRAPKPHRILTITSLNGLVVHYRTNPEGKGLWVQLDGNTTWTPWAMPAGFTATGHLKLFKYLNRSRILADGDQITDHTGWKESER